MSNSSADRGVKIYILDKNNPKKKETVSRNVFEVTAFYWRREDGYIFLYIEVSGKPESAEYEVFQIEGEGVILENVSLLVYRYKDPEDVTHTERSFKLAAAIKNSSIIVYRELTVINEASEYWVTSVPYPFYFKDSILSSATQIGGRVLDANSLGLSHFGTENSFTSISAISGTLRIVLHSYIINKKPSYYIRSDTLYISNDLLNISRVVKIFDESSNELGLGVIDSQGNLTIDYNSSPLSYNETLIVKIYNGNWDVISVVPVKDYKENDSYYLSPYSNILYINDSINANEVLDIYDANNNIVTSVTLNSNGIAQADLTTLNLQEHDKIFIIKNSNPSFTLEIYKRPIPIDTIDNARTSISKVAGVLKKSLIVYNKPVDNTFSNITKISGILRDLLIKYDFYEIENIKSSIISIDSSLSNNFIPYNESFIDGWTDAYDPSYPHEEVTEITVQVEAEESLQNQSIDFIKQPLISSLTFEEGLIDESSDTIIWNSQLGSETPSILTPSLFDFYLDDMEIPLYTDITQSQLIAYINQFNSKIEVEEDTSSVVSYNNYILALKPIAYYIMDDDIVNSNGKILDYSGNNYNAECRINANSIGISPDQSSLQPAIRKDSNGCMGFNTTHLFSGAGSTPQCVAPAVPALYNLSKGSFTICFWAKKTGESSFHHTITQCGSPSSGNATNFRIIGNMQLQIEENARGLNPGALALNETAFYCYVFDTVNQLYYGYKNASKTVSTYTGNTAGGRALATHFPAYYDWNYYGFKGYLSDVAFFDKALTDSEILTLYELGKL